MFRIFRGYFQGKTTASARKGAFEDGGQWEQEGPLANILLKGIFNSLSEEKIILGLNWDDLQYQKTKNKATNDNGNMATIALTYISLLGAVIDTHECSAGFVRSNRPKTHGFDVLEIAVWLHQLSEYSMDVDLDVLASHQFWNTPPVAWEPCHNGGACN